MTATLSVKGHHFMVHFVSGRQIMRKNGRTYESPCLIDMNDGTVRITRDRSIPVMISRLHLARNYLVKRFGATSVYDVSFRVRR